VAERRASLQWTTRVNEAYRALKSPVQRASHILELQGVDVAFETNTAMPPDFLTEQMELREALEEATRAKNLGSLDALQKRIDADKRTLEQQLGERIDRKRDFTGAADLVRELKFLEKMEAEIDAAYEAIE
jgi:molecular chaperone HscB